MADFVHSPEASAVEFFLRRMYLTVVNGTIHVNQFALPLAVEDIMSDMLWCEIGDAQFFSDFTPKCLFRRFAIIQMPSYRRIPFTRLDILPLRAALQIDLTTTVKHMQMNHGM